MSFNEMFDPEAEYWTLDRIVAQNVRRLREEKKWSVATLAEELDRPKHVVYDMERPRKGQKQRAFSWGELVALCGALDTNLFELVLPPQGVRVVGPEAHLLIPDTKVPILGDSTGVLFGNVVGRDGLSYTIFGIRPTSFPKEFLDKKLNQLAAEVSKAIERVRTTSEEE